MKNSVMVLLVVISMMACSSVKMDSPETATTLVEFSKSPCFGNCPSYSLAIKTDGSMEYIGKRNVQRMGVFTKQLDKETYNSLFTALKKENMYQYNDIYDEETRDGSKTRIVYFGTEGRKAFGTMFTFPGNTKQIAGLLEEIAVDEKGWKASEIMNSKDEMEKEDEPTRKLISYSQGACFGQCPSFTIDIFSDGRMLYVGKSYAKLQGIYEKSIGEKDLRTILDLVESKAFNEVNTRDDERIMDAQTFKVFYYPTINETKEVKWKINDAEVLENIKSFFKKQSESRGWKQKTNDDATNPKELENTLIISLSPEVKPKDWILTKRHLNAKIVKFLSPNMTYFLMSFDPALNANRVAEELRRDKFVLNVQSSNNPARPRTTKRGQSGKKGTVNIRDNGGE